MECQPLMYQLWHFRAFLGTGGPKLQDAISLEIEGNCQLTILEALPTSHIVCDHESDDETGISLRWR